VAGILHSVPPSALFLLLVLVAFIAFVLIESRRQRKKYGPRTGARAIGAGMLDVQQMLQADRKVEIVQKQNRREEVVVAESDDDGDQ
jgi:hypothetical protein